MINKKLHGLLNYKLQFTSFFSIMQRLSGFALFFFFIWSFLNQILFYNFFFFNYSIFLILKMIIFLVMFYLFIYHLINGLRIYYMASYYFNVFSNKLVGVNYEIYFLILKFFKNKIITKSKKNSNKWLVFFFEKGLILYLNILFFLRNYFIKSRLLFIFLIFLIYVIFLLFFIL